MNLINELSEAASKQGYRNIDQLLSSKPQWEPEVPVDRVAPEEMEEANKLRSALLPALLTQHKNPGRAELEAIGLEAYRREFGHTITARHWWNLFNRTVQRDGGAEQWSNVSLYISEHPKLAPQNPAEKIAAAGIYEDLVVTLHSFRDSANPTETEKDKLWLEAAQWFEDRIEAGHPKRQAKADLISFLLRYARFLIRADAALPDEAMRKTFERQYQRWINSGRRADALMDGRQKRKGQKLALLPEADKHIIEAHAVFKTGGRLAQAVNELAALGDRSGLSEGTLARIEGGRIPHTIRDAVKHEVRMVAPYRLGKLHIDNATAHLSVDWDKVPSGAVFSADDFTFPVYFWIPDGRGWYTLTRGQTLMMADARSNCVLGLCLIPARNYSGLSIRTLITKVCSQKGLPKIFWFENGIWKRSILLKGDKNSRRLGFEDPESVAFSWGECEHGLERLGVQFKHARKARSKPKIERIGGMMQNLMEGEPGYCGREERHDCPEVTRRNKLLVESRQASPERLFYSFEQWHARLGEIMEHYNNTAQRHGSLNGLTPLEAFDLHKNQSDPPVEFNSQCRHLLSHHKATRQVRENGIEVQGIWYRDAQTGAMRGRTVCVYWDPENPEFITVTDLNGNNPVCVERSYAVNPLDANSKHFKREIAKAQSHSTHAQTLWHVLKKTDSGQQRTVIVDPRTAAVSEAIAAQRQEQEEKEAAKAADARKVYQIRQNALSIGVPIPETPRNPERVKEGIELYQTAMERLAKRAASPTPNPDKDSMS